MGGMYHSPDSNFLKESDRPESLAVRFCSVIVLIATIAFLILGFTYSVFAAYRGLDLTDESFYLLQAKYPKEYLRQIWQWQVATAPLVEVLQTVPRIRIARLVLLSLANGAFAFSFVRFLLPRFVKFLTPTENISIFLCVTSTTFLADIWLPQGIGYNETALFFLHLVLALVLYATSRHSTTSVPFLMIGLLTPFLMFSKPTVLVAVLPLAVISMTAHDSWHRLQRSILPILTGIVLSSTSIHFFYVPLPEIISNYKKALMQVDELHKLSYLLRNWVGNFSGFINAIYRDFSLAFPILLCIGMLTIFFWRKKIPKSTTPCFLLGTLVFFKATGHLQGGDINLEKLQFSLPIIACIAIALLAISLKEWGSRSQKFFLALALFLTPLLASFGSAQSIFVSGLIFGASWFLLILLPILNISRRRIFFTVAISCVLTLTSLLVGYEGRWLNPYRQVPLRDANVTLDQPQLFRGLRVDATTAAFVIGLRNVTRRYSSVPYVISTDRMAGAVLALDGFQPIYSWTVDEWPDRTIESLNAACSAGDRPVILVSSGENSSLQLKNAARQSCAGEWEELGSIPGPRGAVTVSVFKPLGH